MFDSAEASLIVDPAISRGNHTDGDTNLCLWERQNPERVFRHAPQTSRSHPLACSEEPWVGIELSSATQCETLQSLEAELS